MIEYLTFDDVLIRPQYSEIETRESVNTAPDFLGLDMKVPIISANMDYVTGPDMAIAMWLAGGLGILHRFAPQAELTLNAAEVSTKKVPLIPSIGVKGDSFYLATVYESLGAHAICIDVAHGDHKLVVDLIKKIRAETYLKVIAGNVATKEGFWRLAEAGADAVKIGIGPGSVCTTRTVTGVGVPQLSAIMYIADAREASPQYAHVKLIADGGIKNSGDIVKALGAGADVVMLGHLLAGATEAPGPVIEVGDGRRYRSYRGQSIFGTNGMREVPEGISGYVEEKGPVERIIRQLAGGLRSGMSYVGATNLKELQENCEFIRVSPMSHVETNTRVRTSV